MNTLVLFNFSLRVQHEWRTYEYGSLQVNCVRLVSCAIDYYCLFLCYHELVFMCVESIIIQPASCANILPVRNHSYFQQQRVNSMILTFEISRNRLNNDLNIILIFWFQIRKCASCWCVCYVNNLWRISSLLNSPIEVGVVGIKYRSITACYSCIRRVLCYFSRRVTKVIDLILLIISALVERIVYNTRIIQGTVHVILCLQVGSRPEFSS